MGFIEAYKRLEKLCGEALDDERCVSAYIDEMLNTSRGSYLVSGWDDDLKNLKHYRWVRNKIVHEPDCTEQNMCEFGDVKWIEGFYKRIMKQSDPLALYRKAVRKQKNTSSKQIHKIESHQKVAHSKPLKPKKTKKLGKAAALLLGAMLIVVLIDLILKLF